MPWAAVLPLITAGVSAISKQQQQDEQRKQRAIDTRYSPWTHITPGTIQADGALQGGIAGGIAGMDQNQKAQNSQAWRDWMAKSNGPAQNANVMPGSGSWGG